MCVKMWVGEEGQAGNFLHSGRIIDFSIGRRFEVKVGAQISKDFEIVIGNLEVEKKTILQKK